MGARCNRGGVKIVDVSNPKQPQLVGTAADEPNTRAEDVMVIDARTPSFEGKLMAVGLQDCKAEESEAEPGLQGLQLWDVTDPAQPERLGFHDVGPLLFGGVHELYLFQRSERVFALLAVPLSEAFHADGLGDLRIVEVSDPRHPVQLADWGAGKDAGLPFGASAADELLPESPPPPGDCTPPEGGDELCRGDIPWVIAHSASASEDGNRAYISYWDAGMVILDISEPSQPTLIGRAVEPLSEEGNLHSAIEAPGGRLAITTDEDFIHLAGDGPHAGPGGDRPATTASPGGSEHEPDDRWGFVRLWDISDPRQPEEIGKFETRHSASSRTDGYFTVHNPEAHGDLLYLSWYSDGVRVVDISEPGSPREVASFVPPPTTRPRTNERPPLVWGVHNEGDLVFLSDIAAGLYILEQTGGN